VDVQQIDLNFQQLEGQTQQTVRAIAALGQKLQAAGQAGDPNAREWQLDLREIAVQIQSEQNQVGALLQAIHGFVAQQAQQPYQVQQQQYAPPPAQYAPPPPQYPQAQPNYPPQPQYQQGYPQGGYSQGGGAMQRFLHGSFGQAIMSGAGFGIGEDVIERIFD
jgi:hypothetical protein